MERARPVNGFSALQQLSRPRPPTAPGETCDLCGVPNSEEHGHVVDVQNRGMLCACRACYLLFMNAGAGKGRYRSVPDCYVHLEGFELSRRQWQTWQIPVDMAFIFINSTLERPVAFYPSPGGAVESTLALGALSEVMADNAVLAGMEPDVEALLVRYRNDGSECFILPIDRCYELVGELRLLWRGFDGGEEVHRRIDEFFEAIRGLSRSGD